MQLAHLILEIVAALTAGLGLALSVRDLRDAMTANRDLARSVASSDPDRRAELRDLLNIGDVTGAVAAISRHVDALPPRERVKALDALTQRSPSGREVYAHMIAAAAGLRDLRTYSEKLVDAQRS